MNPTLKIDSDGIGWLTFDDPGRRLNVFTESILSGLSERLDEAGEEIRSGTLRGLVVWSGKKDSFIAGADLEAMKTIEDPARGEEAARAGQLTFKKVSDLQVPTVSAIHGICLGGGAELSLACRYRLASDSEKTKIGFPEVQLGILPAWGGTTRLPGLIGLQAALDLILTGRQVSGRSALRLRLVDDIYPAELFQEKTRKFLLARIEKLSLPSRRPPLFHRLLNGNPVGRNVVLRVARKNVLAETGGHYPAPLKILEVVKRSRGKTLERALELEAKAAGELIPSGVCKNLLHIFDLREEARKGTGVAQPVETDEVKRLAVLGAGVMGGGIAQLAAYKGIRVRVKDIQHEAVGKALRHAKELFDKAVKRRRLSRRDGSERMELISAGLDYDGFGAADLVIEAVVEKLDVKKAVLGETERHITGRCVLASNTSSLSIDEIAESLERPERFCGIHFFNPVHKMPLVEVIRGKQTDDRTVATAYAFAVAVGKVPVVVRNGPGFLVNRILGPYLNEAGFLVAEGASVESVDRAATRFGMPMGPLRLIDEIGIDIARHAGESLQAAFGERMAMSPPLTSLEGTGRLGKKGGLGFYRYTSGKKEEVDPEIYHALGQRAPNEKTSDKNASNDSLDEKRIRARLVLAMINEAAWALEDGIVESAADVDLAMIMGTGFPPFRGGLLRFADSLPLRTVLHRLREVHSKSGVRFEPAPLIARLSEKDQTFYEAFP